MVAQTHIGSTKQVVALQYAATNIGDANGTFVSLQGADTSSYPMAYRGSVIGAALHLNGTLTTGSIQVAPVINGVAKAAITNYLHGATQTITARRSARQSDYSFQAGDRIGAIWQKSGTIAPTDRDATLVLFVLLEGVDY